MNEAAYYFTFSLGSSSRVYEILEGAMRTRCYSCTLTAVSCLRGLAMAASATQLPMGSPTSSTLLRAWFMHHGWSPVPVENE